MIYGFKKTAFRGGRGLYCSFKKANHEKTILFGRVFGSVGFLQKTNGGGFSK